MRRLVAGFMHERPGEAPAARGRRADACIHGGLRWEALKPTLRGTVPCDRGAITDDAEASAGYIQAGHLVQANPASLCLAVLGGCPRGKRTRTVARSRGALPSEGRSQMHAAPATNRPSGPAPVAPSYVSSKGHRAASPGGDGFTGTRRMEPASRAREARSVARQCWHAEHVSTCQ